eukprot:454-Pyramimonas_sp.AAC.2
MLRSQVRGGDMSANNLWLLCSLVETLHHHIGWLKGKQLLLPAAVYTVLRILPDAQALKRNGSGAQGDGSAAASVLLAKGVPFCSDLLREYTSDYRFDTLVARALSWGPVSVPITLQNPNFCTLGLVRQTLQLVGRDLARVFRSAGKVSELEPIRTMISKRSDYSQLLTT